jgi:RNA polymerase sigma-B factor
MSAAPRRLASDLDEATIVDRFRELRATGDRRLRNQLVEHHRWVAAVAARRFANRGEPHDDLLQVALLGVLKAVERFDPEYGSAFATFAFPTVMGELRRYFRDATWSLRVNRRAKELHLALNAAIEDLTHQLGRSPGVSDLAVHLGVGDDDVLEAMEAGRAYRAASLNQRPSEDGGSTEDLRVLATDDHGLASADVRLALHQLLSELPPRERRILHLRFFEDLTQSEIAGLVGVSQVHVSRLLRSSLGRFRRHLEEAPRLAG